MSNIGGGAGGGSEVTKPSTSKVIGTKMVPMINQWGSVYGWMQVPILDTDENFPQAVPLSLCKSIHYF